jgi:replicative DNA helicase
MEEQTDEAKPPFGTNEEKAIISLAFDCPEFFSQIVNLLTYKYFQKLEHKVVYKIIQQCFEKHNTIPTRDIAVDIAKRNLTTDQDWEPIINAITRKSDYREMPIIKSLLIDWAKNKAYGELYNNDSYQSWVRKDYSKLEEVIDKAKRITDISNSGIRFFDNLDLLFKEDKTEKLTTGFPMLDVYINCGGPSRGDVFVWMGPTGRGKSVLLVHNGKTSLEKGMKVLHITLEMTVEKTMERYMGSLTEEKISSKHHKRDVIEQKLLKAKSSTNGDLIVVSFPPDEISVDTIRQLIDYLKRTKSWKPDVLIVDYLELMVSRNSSDNKEEWMRQKKVSTQLCGLAKTENILIFTATQTNRDGLNGSKEKQDNGELIGLNKVSESYGKLMPVDYCVSINQNQDEYNQEIPIYRLYIIKNRNGQKEQTIRVRVNYSNMVVKQEDF